MRSFLTLTGTVTGVTLSYYLANTPYYNDNPILGEDPEIKLSIVLGMFGFLIGSMISREIERYCSELFKKISLYEAIAGIAGFIVGLLIANLMILLPAIIFLNSATSDSFPDYIKKIIPILKILMPFIINFFFGYVGMSLCMRYYAEIIKLISGKHVSLVRETEKYLDTSVLVDGRIYDILKTKFIDGNIVIAEFVINELQFIADSQDTLKRSKGRRGLDILNKMQTEFSSSIHISSEDCSASRAVDEKLIALARKNNAKILTTDYNLNKVAQIHGLEVLNINDLANSLKPIVMPGEAMTLHVIKEGKEHSQGVGYLPDGTMVIVEDGSDCIGKTVDVVVTSMLQTAAGRLVFTRTRAGFESGPETPSHQAAPENNENVKNKKDKDNKKDNDAKIIKMKK
ncbi:MAG TPA: PIN domain nuclease [Candidatus Wallbacteria bacterium]|nr:PIN domain nuclease [Candidatus Wallbacteria bacterium]